MSEEVEYRCFIGGLAWSTSDRGLRDAFEKYGHLLEAKVVLDKFSGRSRGFGFITFDEKKAMDEAIAAMNGMDLDGRTITVDKAQPQGGSGRDHDGDRSRDRGYDRDRSRPSGGRGSGGGDCFKCGKPGHFARECPDESGRGGGGGRYSSRDDRYSSKDDRYSSKDDRYSAKDDRYGAKEDRYGREGGREGGRDRYGPDRSGERSGGRSRDDGSRGGSGGERHGRAPYDRPRDGGFH
ncbi:hypothetical protein N665_1274s0007 [Sinapis alba]|nr:hypothetical protein N665_1274s0007 [Sinapis alba]